MKTVDFLKVSVVATVMAFGLAACGEEKETTGGSAAPEASMTESMKDSSDAAMDKAGEMADESMEAVGEAAEDTMEKAGEMTDDAAAAAEDAAKDVEKEADDAADDMKSKMGY